jgi:pyridoxine kinase
MKKLLSIQSHVVHGYVGNRAATFPLQVRGWDVDVLNTVQFSNHPAYGQFTGQRFDAENLREVYEGLKSIGVDYVAILTGYVPGDEALKAISEICLELCGRGIKWILDPVLGDHGKIYVSKGNVEIYKTILKSGTVSVVTPNQLELEVLSGVKVHDLTTLKSAINTFNDLYNVENLVVTSVQLCNDPSNLYSAGSTRISDGNFRSFYFRVPSIPAAFSGSGDLFSALLTSTVFKYNERYGSTVTDETQIQHLPLAYALNEVLSIVEKVLQLTYDYETEAYKLRGDPIPENLKINDLKLIQGKEYYLQDMANHRVCPL